jgi:hypothetical protein
VLAIPISIIASESAFSTSGCIVDDFRSLLTPFMVEALVRTQDWLRISTPVNIVENTEQLTKVEEGNYLLYHLFSVFNNENYSMYPFFAVSIFRNYSRIQEQSHC